MLKVLFVCTGNICRSPMAEGILKAKLKKLKIDATVDSCGFESFHTGDPPDSRAIYTASKHWIDISDHRARLFREKDFDEFDHILVMDSGHFRQVTRRCRTEADHKKVEYLLNYLAPGRNQEVMDPWYHDQSAFEKVFIQMEAAIDKFIDQVI